VLSGDVYTYRHVISCLSEMISERVARCITLMITFAFLVQIVPIGQANIALAEQPQNHSTPRIIAYGSGVASVCLGANQIKSTVLFSLHRYYVLLVRPGRYQRLLASPKQRFVHRRHPERRHHRRLEPDIPWRLSYLHLQVIRPGHQLLNTHSGYPVRDRKSDRAGGRCG
jgi:hypothetical protein